jgi:hypothetical protein
MRRVFPSSLIFFVITGVVFALQAMPVPGIYLMMVMAMLWPVLLVNAGLIGIAAEAAIGRVSRWWLIVPVMFYGGYWAVAVQDRLALHKLSASFDAANARVVTGFDPERQAITFDESDGQRNGAWLTQNYALPVAYSVNENVPEGYLSQRMLDNATCAKVRENLAAGAASVSASGFSDGSQNGYPKREERFCALSMPETPDVPVVRVSQQVESLHVGSLPVTRITTNIAMPDGRSVQVQSGHAAPLRWFPMPMMGCGLNSSAPSWNCFAGFLRDTFTPIIPGASQYNRREEALAKALGLKPVAISERRGADPERVLAKITGIEDVTLARQLANIDAMIRDPVAKVADWQVGLVLRRPEALESRADAIMAGVEHAAAITGDDRDKAKESGLILARLLAGLPGDRFLRFGPRILAIYAKANDEHWLWSADRLLRRMGSLGVDALPYLLKPAALRLANAAGIEGLCRIGEAGRVDVETTLLALWNRSRAGVDRDAREAMFVAMRRIGMTPPALADDPHGQFARLEAEWADISTTSPSRVCATDAERQARREERYEGKRRTNID